MSHSTGAAKFPDGKIFYCEYNGTVDIMLPHLYKTNKEMFENWRRKDWIQCNNLSHKHIRVRLATTYGGGFSWDGWACLDCLCLISPLDVNYDTEKSGVPDWYPSEMKLPFGNRNI